jgi:hypothetical protein
MNRYRVLTIMGVLIIVASGLYAVVLHLAEPKPVWFSDQIIFTTVPDTSSERVTEIVAALHATLLQSPGFPKDSPNWVISIPWAKTEAEMNHIVQQLTSFAEIQHAEVNGIAGSLD